MFYDETAFEVYQGDTEEDFDLETFKELFPLRSTSQITAPALLDDDLVAVIEMPVDIHLKARYQADKDRKANSRHTIKLLFEVFSIDNWDINRYQGFGVLSVDLASGKADRRVQIMRPRRSMYQRFKEFFIGGNYYIKNKKSFVFEENNEENGELNLYNRILEFECELEVGVSVCQFSAKIKNVKRKEHQEMVIRKEVLKNKVNLQSN